MNKTLNEKFNSMNTFLKMIMSGIGFVFAGVLQGQPQIVHDTYRHRMIVLTDIEADPDDTQSLVRLLLYSNQIDIKGIVATTSTHMRYSIHPESIIKVIEGYEKVQPNLLLHEPGYPNADKLLECVKSGVPVYGMNGVGEGKDSEGSDWIIKILEEKDTRPLWITAWGGTNVLAQALLKIKNTKNRKEAERLLAKLRVYAISDQDDSGIWIRNNFPELFYIVSPGNYGRSTWIAINQVHPSVNNEVISNQWICEHIQQGHGALGVLYPDVMWGMEGDTPSFLSLIPNGLNEPEHPDFGGWGGRYEFYQPKYVVDEGAGGVETKPETRPIWTNADDRFVPIVNNPYGRSMQMEEKLAINDNRATILRWREDFQNDFAARMDWCVKDYASANHPPVPAFAHEDKITLKSGEWFTLDATGTYDPDGDAVSYLWLGYPEAGTCKKTVINTAEVSYRATIVAPEVNKLETVHIILKVTDKGVPQLSRYKRLVLSVVPR